MTPPTLVVVYLRGGADGLTLVPPYADPRYRELRPALAVNDSWDLDGYFGLHPQLIALKPAWEAGELAVVHGVGSDDRTRSHFDAQDRMEHAGAAAGTVGSGWLARHLATRPGPPAGSLAAVAWGPKVPESLRGTAAAAITSLDAYRLPTGPLMAGLPSLYAGSGPVEAAGRDMLATMARLDGLGEPRSTAVTYPDGEFANALRHIASLIRSHAGLEVATVDLGGWDTHFFQSSLFGGLAQTLAEGLAAFREDLGDNLERVTVLVMTEFGRRLYENASLGTDHGRASAMFVWGGQVAGGKVVAQWPGLDDPAREDLPVTIDYRDILAEILERHGNPALSQVLPEYTPIPRAILR